jgi:chlorophyll synthase
MEQPITTTPPLVLEKPPLLKRSIALMKPITWFGPTWAFLCGTIASGATTWGWGDFGRILLGMLMAGPILCGFSQVINDYCDREVDALNEPQRLIPSGRVSTAQVFVTMGLLLLAGLLLSLYLNVFPFVALGIFLAVIYSAPPIRAKRNGWVGNLVVAISYEGLAWMAGHAAFGTLTSGSIAIALLYSFGTHGIMSINDYKSIAGDKLSGIKTIPAQYGAGRTAWIIVGMMNVAQTIVILLFVLWGQWLVVAALIALFLLQLPTQRAFVKEPTKQYLKFSAVGVSFFVWGMMAAAIGLRLV